MQKQMFIAVIDDDHDDFTFLHEAFEKFHSIPVRHFDKGTRFFDLSLDMADYICLFVIDLNMPETGGIEVCQKIKENPSLKSTPVVVFTTGGTPSEMKICNGLNIEVIKKPSSLTEWENIAQKLVSQYVTSLDV